MDIKERAKKFKEVVEHYRKSETCFNIIISQMDPDAIGSAMGTRYALKCLGAHRTRILYSGTIGHQQNRSIITKYDLTRKMTPLADMQGSFTDRDVYILVDSSSTTDGRLGSFTDFKPVITIDHHRAGNVLETDNTFAWIEDIGACSTMVIELLTELGLLSFSREDVAVPVILALGVYTDTKSLVDCDNRDRLAYGLIATHAKDTDLKQLIDYPYTPSYMRSLKNALDTSKREGADLVCTVGFISADNSDDIALIANEMIRQDGITLAVVWGIVENKEMFVRLSARSDPSRPLSEFLRKRFGDKTGAKLSPDGTSEGGGIVELDLGFWATDKTKKLILDLVTERINEAVFEE